MPDLKQPDEIKVGEIAFLKLTGEPVFVLGKFEERTATITATYRAAPGGTADPMQQAIQNVASQVPYADFVVRRYKQGSQYGNDYVTAHFTTAELTSQSPNNPQALLDKLFAQAADEGEVIEVIPETETKPLAN